MEGKKKRLESDRINREDSDSSRDALSEINAVVQLENEVAMKNRHIRKLLIDIKVLNISYKHGGYTCTCMLDKLA